MKHTITLMLVFVCIACNGQKSEDYFANGIERYDIQDYKGAIQAFNKAIELQPELVSAYLNRGVSKSALKDYRGAIQDYTKTIEIKPDYAQAYAHRGLAKIMLKDKDGGCLDLSKAGELGYFEAYDMIKKFCN